MSMTSTIRRTAPELWEPSGRQVNLANKTPDTSRIYTVFSEKHLTRDVLSIEMFNNTFLSPIEKSTTSIGIVREKE